MADDVRVEHQPDARRWVAFDGDTIASALDYADDGQVVSMTRTFTNPPYRGRGIAGLVVAAAVDDAAAHGRRVRPMCWYVDEWFEQHPERAGLLAP